MYGANSSDPLTGANENPVDLLEAAFDHENSVVNTTRTTVSISEFLVLGDSNEKKAEATTLLCDDEETSNS